MDIRTYTLPELTEVLRSGFRANNGAQIGGPFPAKRDITAVAYNRFQFCTNNSLGAWPSTEHLLGLTAADSNNPARCPYYYGKWMLQVFVETALVGNAGDTIDIFAYFNDGQGASMSEIYRRNYYLTGALPIGATIIDLQMQQDMLLQNLRIVYNISSLGGNLKWNWTFDGIQIFWRG